MRYRQLGRTGITVSEIGFGAWGIGGAMWQGSDDERSLAALAAALDAGCTFIDTALVYGDGHSEQLVAKALAARTGPVAVATKIPPKSMIWPALPGVTLADAFPVDHVLRCAERSAENLGRPIDLLQFHVWRDDWLMESGWRAVEQALGRLIAAGTLRHVGISINDHEPESALEAVRRVDLVGVVQVIYNIFDQSPGERLYPACRERNIGVIARVPFDEGGLTGAIAPGVATSAEELFRRAARLARVELRRPARALGRTTEESLQAGVLWGAAGQVDALVRRLALEMKGTPTVIVTLSVARCISAAGLGPSRVRTSAR